MQPGFQCHVEDQFGFLVLSLVGVAVHWVLILILDLLILIYILIKLNVLCSLPLLLLKHGRIMYIWRLWNLLNRLNDSVDGDFGIVRPTLSQISNELLFEDLVFHEQEIAAFVKKLEVGVVEGHVGVAALRVLRILAFAFAFYFIVVFAFFHHSNNRY